MRRCLIQAGISPLACAPPTASCGEAPPPAPSSRTRKKPSAIDQPPRQRTGIDPDPAVAHAERGQKRDHIGRLGRDLLLQDHLDSVVDNAHRRFLHRHIKTDEMRHLIAPSSMPEAKPTPIQSSSQKGMRAHHPNRSRSRRDTPSLGAQGIVVSGAGQLRRLLVNGPVCARAPIASYRDRDQTGEIAQSYQSGESRNIG